MLLLLGGRIGMGCLLTFGHFLPLFFFSTSLLIVSPQKQVVTLENEMLGVAAERAVAEATSNMPRLYHFHRQPIGYLL